MKKKPTELYQTVGLMLSDDFKERLIGEFHQCRLRVEGLSAALQDKDAEYLCRDLMEIQLVCMSQYLMILGKRLAAMDVADCEFDISFVDKTDE